MFDLRQRRLLTSEFILILVNLISVPLLVNSKCNKGCDLALASYYVWRGTNLTFIAQMFSIPTRQEIMDYNNKESIPNQDSVIAGTRINVPFSCDCLDGEFLGHVFQYKVNSGDFYDRIAATYYSDLTTAEWLMKFNKFPENNIPDTGVNLKVVVNCSCGDKEVSKDYGLFVTYPLRKEDNLTSLASMTNVSEDLLQRYNPGKDFDAEEGIVYIPGRGPYKYYPEVIGFSEDQTISTKQEETLLRAESCFRGSLEQCPLNACTMSDPSLYKEGACTHSQTAHPGCASQRVIIY